MVLHCKVPRSLTDSNAEMGLAADPDPRSPKNNKFCFVADMEGSYYIPSFPDPY